MFISFSMSGDDEMLYDNSRIVSILTFLKSFGILVTEFDSVVFRSAYYSVTSPLESTSSLTSSASLDLPLPDSSLLHDHLTLRVSSSPLLSSITPSFFHSKLKPFFFLKPSSGTSSNGFRGLVSAKE